MFDLSQKFLEKETFEKFQVRHLRNLIANVADPLDFFVTFCAVPDLNATLPAYAVSAARASRANIVKSTKRRTASCAFASLMR